MKIVFFVVVTLASPAFAHAVGWETCMGSPIKWRDELNLYRNQCTIANSGDINTAYWNGVQQWDSLSHVVDHYYVQNADDCSVGGDDGQNEIGIVSADSIDGNLGLAVEEEGFCFFSSSLHEVDVYIASNQTFENKAANFLGQSGRGTFVHELGHLFGFEHDDTSQTIMQPGTNDLLTGGNVSSTIWPADAIAMNALYGMVTALPNLLPSAQYVQSANNVQLLDIGQRHACVSQAVTVRFFLGNLGSTSAPTYTIRLRLNDTYVTGWTQSKSPFSGSVYNFTFLVPSLPQGTYTINLDMDAANVVSEIREGDNGTRSGMQLVIDC